MTDWLPFEETGEKSERLEENCFQKLVTVVRSVLLSLLKVLSGGSAPETFDPWHGFSSCHPL